MKKAAWVFWAIVFSPFVLGSMLVTSNAQTVQYNATYVKRAVADIAAIEAIYDTARGYYDGGEAQADAQATYGELGDLIERLAAKPAPLPATGIHEQIVFAAKRCQNYAAKIGWLTPDEKASVFVAIAEIQLREFCAVQMHAAKMRLIDYGIANGVNPYE